MKRRPFSQRHGHVPVPVVLQTEGITDELANRLWDVIDRVYLQTEEDAYVDWQEQHQKDIKRFRDLWTRFFKVPWDTAGSDPTETVAQIREQFFNLPWFGVYDFLEFVSSAFASSTIEADLNTVLEEELSGYRLIDGEAVPLTSPAEIDAVVRCVESELDSVSRHAEEALRLLAERQQTDFRNSIKESISMVEAVCRLLTSDPTATLGQAVKVLEQKHALHPAFKEAIAKLYGWASDGGGIRHSLNDESEPASRDTAKFVLVLCSGIANYLLASLKVPRPEA